MSAPGADADRAPGLPFRSHAVPMLQLFALTVMVIPSDTVIKAIGAEGYAAALVGMFAFAAFLAATLLGFHNPLRHRHPIRGVLCLVWVWALVSYVLMDRGTLTGAQVTAADRLIIQLTVITGVALVAAEGLNSLRDIRRVLRALTWGGAFCGAVAALQFWVSLDITPALRVLPGFSLNLENPAIVGRADLNRVAGTSLTAIELGVVGGMLLPLAVYLAMHDKDRSALKRWAPVALTALAIPASVSRSGVISVALAFSVFVVLMPPRQRVIALCAAPLAVAAVFMSAHGLIGTLTAFFTAGKDDDSVMARLYDYPEAERLVRQEPWFGHGGGTYLPEYPMYILDNQYLKTAIELGLIGVLVIAAYLLVPLLSALVARRRSSDPELRLLCGALAGAASAAAVCSLTFDSLSFPMFSCVYALVIGLIGASWRLAAPARPATVPVGVTLDPLPFRTTPSVSARAIAVVGAGWQLAVRVGLGLIDLVRAGSHAAVRAGRGLLDLVGAGWKAAVRAGLGLVVLVGAGWRLVVATGRALIDQVAADWRLVVMAGRGLLDLVRAGWRRVVRAGRGLLDLVGAGWRLVVATGRALIDLVGAGWRLAVHAERGLIDLVGSGWGLAVRAGRRAAEPVTVAGSTTRAGSVTAGIVMASLIAAACGVLVWGPWHGPVVLALSESHGVDAGDLAALPLIALAVAIGQARARDALARPRWWVGRWAAVACAVVLGGLLLLVSVVDATTGPPLIPAGGGTFDGSTQHADGRRADPVDRWSHLALTYDGAALRLYVDGTQVSSRATTGTILRTTDPLWIGGNRPYAEHFDGVIDELRVYERAQSPSQVRAEMSRPIARGGIPHSAGLVAAYAFDAGSGTTAADASGNGNTGTIQGATWTPRGRFGRALRFDGEDARVRVPASASLDDPRTAMTLSAWIRPSVLQPGWRTIMHRQTDAYFLMAGGGHDREAGAGILDEARLALLIIAAVWFCVALTGGRAQGVGGGRRRYWPPVALFVVGSIADAALAPSDTLIGPTIVTMWYALTASRRAEAAMVYILAAAFAGVTVMSVVGDLELADQEGGVARSAALGLLLVTAGLLSARYGARGGEQATPHRA